MHPILETRWRTLGYLSGWLPVVALLDYLTWAQGGISWWENAGVLAPGCFLLAFACLSPWSIGRTRPLRMRDVSVLAWTWVAAAVAASGIFTGAVWAMARIQKRPMPHLDLLFAVGGLLYLLSAGVHYAVLAGEASREAALEATEAKGLARDAELQTLRMQINPHFLFNSLHSIAALTAVDAARARDMCIRLADFLRSSLGVGGRESIALREELALARSYLEVERVRFGVRLRFTEEIQETCAECAVPVLLLQPLIENAVKHGIAGLPEGGEIRLTVARTGESVRVAVENAFDTEAAPHVRLGMGLVQVRRRLELRYGGGASFDAGTRDGVYRVELSFPCEPVPLASESAAPGAALSPMASSSRV
jgi:two-component system sensor histidine kinase AlgZ